MNYIDLFSGIGGFALGAYWAGMKFENHYFSEVEPYCVELYQKRFPDAIPLGDISGIDCEKLADTESDGMERSERSREERAQKDVSNGGRQEWIITGGFPCQDISVAGKGAGIKGSRSGLWAEYRRIIREIRPRYAIIENVAALTFRGLDRVLSDLAAIGYDAEWQDIRAEDVGAPHRRERIWIVAYPASESTDRLTIRKTPAFAMSRNLGKIPDAESGIHTSDSSKMGRAKQTNKIKAQVVGNPQGENRRTDIAETVRSGGYENPNEDQCCPWATEPDVGRLAHGVSHRVDRLRGTGNAILPEIAELLFAQIRAINP